MPARLDVRLSPEFLGPLHPRKRAPHDGALRKIGYQEAVSPEIMERLKGKPPEEAARLALDAPLGVMRTAGMAG